MNIILKESDKANFFGNFTSNILNFKFNACERSLIYSFVKRLNDPIPLVCPEKEKIITDKSKVVKNWFSDVKIDVEEKVVAPAGAENMLQKMMYAARKNTHRPKNGYRYDDLDFKRFIVMNRILGGPITYKSLQSNLKGCFPSISTINKYTSINAVIWLWKVNCV